MYILRSLVVLGLVLLFASQSDTQFDDIIRGGVSTDNVLVVGSSLKVTATTSVDDEHYDQGYSPLDLTVHAINQASGKIYSKHEYVGSYPSQYNTSDVTIPDVPDGAYTVWSSLVIGFDSIYDGHYYSKLYKSVQVGIAATTEASKAEIAFTDGTPSRPTATTVAAKGVTSLSTLPVSHQLERLPLYLPDACVLLIPVDGGKSQSSQIELTSEPTPRNYVWQSRGGDILLRQPALRYNVISIFYVRDLDTSIVTRYGSVWHEDK